MAFLMTLSVPQSSVDARRRWLRPVLQLVTCNTEVDNSVHCAQCVSVSIHYTCIRGVSISCVALVCVGGYGAVALLPVATAAATREVVVQSLTFNPNADPVAFATTLALVLMPLSYALQARFSLQQKADNYKADIDELLLMRQRSSNSGALL